MTPGDRNPYRFFVRGPVLGLIAILSSAATPAPTADDLRRNYQACPGQDVLQRAFEIGWETRPSQIEAHRALRAALHVAMPEGATRILWYAVGGHLATITFSVVAVRRADGSWHVDGAGQSLIWAEGAQPVPLGRMERDLSVEEGRRLDALLEDPCLYAGPAYLAESDLLGGGLTHTLEIEMPARRWIGSWHALSTRQESDVVNMIGEH